jgi:predicted RNA binding protein YcfA (HicA-like mRNA interferase family)
MTRPLPALKPKKVLQALKRAGFFVHHIEGSHYILKHPDRPNLRVTVPYHNKDLKRKTLGTIIKQAGFTTEDFIEFL